MARNVVVQMYPERIRAGARLAFSRSLDDAAGVAYQRAPKKTTRLARSIKEQRRGEFGARIIATAPYAKAREKGAYIVAKTPNRLRFRVNGQWKSPRMVRQKGKPYLGPVVRIWARQLFPNRLREVFHR